MSQKSIIKLKVNQGHKPPPLNAVHPPSDCTDIWTPQGLVDLLAEYDGDVEQFARAHIGNRHDKSPMQIVAQALQILNQKGNETLKADWNALIDAYEEAKLTLIQRKALDWLDKYPMPPLNKGKNAKIPPLADFTAAAKFWMTADAHVEKAKGTKRRADKPTDTPDDDTAAIEAALTGNN